MLKPTLHKPEKKGSARQAPGRKLRTQDMTIRRRWPIGRLLRCRSNKMLKFWSASTNEQMAVVVPMTGHEIIHAQQTEWINEPMYQSLNRWTSETMMERSSESMNQWDENPSIHPSTHPFIHPPIHPLSINQPINQSRNQWIMTQRRNESINQ